jgi:hypothetical protein
VVDYVEEIEFRATLSKPPGIIPEAAKDPVGLEQSAVPIAILCESARHARRKTRRVDRVRVVRFQVRQQHLGDEIHAGPILFLVIANYGDAGCLHKAIMSGRLCAESEIASSTLELAQIACVALDSANGITGENSWTLASLMDHLGQSLTLANPFAEASRQLGSGPFPQQGR